MPAWYEPLARPLVLWNRRRLQRRVQSRMPRYAQWAARFDTVGAAERAALQARAAALALRPAIDLLLVPGPAAEQRGPALLASLQAQLHPHWTLHIAVEADAAGAGFWRQQAAAEPRLRLHGGAAAALQHVGDGAWLAWIDADEVWREHTLLLLVEAALARPGCALAYGDEDRLGADGSRRDPQFKCDWNPDLLLGHDCIGRPALWRRDRLAAATALPAPAGGTAWRHGFVLRATAELMPREIVHVPHVLCHLHADAAQQPTADAAAVQAELDRRAEPGRAEPQDGIDGVRVHFALPDPAPSVTLVIPTRNGLALLRRCVDSILERTQYPAYDIVIVDNGSDDPACLAWLEQIAAREPRVRVRRDGQPFNFAALNNAAVRDDARGEFVALVNNDIEVISPGWLTEMTSLAARPGVGAVGARLWYGDGTLQHGGVIVGIGAGAGHAHKRLRRDEGGMAGRAQRLQALSAVTAACLVVRRDTYLAAGGMDAEHFAVAFNDIDFCLRLRARGLRNLWTPHAELYHHESVSRGKDRHPGKKDRFLRERAVLQQRWAPLLANDPAYNPNLTLDSDNFALASPPRVWLLRRWFDDLPDTTP